MAKAPKKPRSNGIQFAGIVTMTLEEWHAVPDNPRQRDTLAHARKAQHLNTLHPSHSVVHAGRLPSGMLYKIDGHTRDYKWSSGEVEGPDHLNVMLWDCPSLADIADLFLTFDAPEAVENVTDLLYGLCNELGIRFTSPALEKFQFASALGTAHAYLFTIGKWPREYWRSILTDWRETLTLFDSVDPVRFRFPGPVMTAALLLLKVDGTKAAPFFRGYQHEEGTKGDGKMDAVQAFHEYMLGAHGAGGFWGATKRSEVIRTAFQAYRAYEKDQVFSTNMDRPLQPMQSRTFQKWIEGHRIDVRLADKE